MIDERYVSYAETLGTMCPPSKKEMRTLTHGKSRSQDHEKNIFKVNKIIYLYL